jgi:hypothetical protein
MTTLGSAVDTTRSARAVVRSPAQPSLLLGEAAVVVGAACLVLHLLMAVGQHSGDVVLTAVVLVMSAACAPCLRALWSGPTRRDWQVTGVMYALMLVAHLCWLRFGPMGAVHSHASGALTWSELGMWAGPGLAGVQLALTAFALLSPSGRNRA